LSTDVNKEEYVVVKLEIKHVPSGKTRQIAHCQVLSIYI
jgi:hypothetical protein